MRRERADKDLIDACLQGDQRAWERLVARYERYVFSIARSEGLSREEAEDLTQTVFLELVQQLHLLDHDSRLASWLGTVSRRTAWRRRDHERRTEPLQPDDDALDTSVSADAEGFADLFALLQSLERLGDSCNQLITRLYLSEGDPTYAVVATELDIPIGSIGPTRSRCLEKLRRLLDSDLDYDFMTFRVVRINETRAEHQLHRPPASPHAHIDHENS